MQTNVIKHICPNCEAIDSDELLTYSFVDNFLSIERHCTICQHTWRDVYGTYYLGYSDNKGDFDIDGIRLRY